MANKFTKGVLDRLEQEAQRQKQSVKEPPQEEKKREEAPKKSGDTPKKPPKAGADPLLSLPKKEAPLLERKPSMKKEAVPTEKKPKPVKKNGEVPDLSAYLRPVTQRTAKNKTFYLDEDVIETLHNAAKQQQVTDSKLVNDILRRIFFLPERS